MAFIARGIGLRITQLTLQAVNYSFVEIEKRLAKLINNANIANNNGVTLWSIAAGGADHVNRANVNLSIEAMIVEINLMRDKINEIIATLKAAGLIKEG